MDGDRSSWESDGYRFSRVEPPPVEPDMLEPNELLERLKKAWPTAEEREEARNKRIAEAEKNSTVFPFAPASWDEVRVRSKEEVERDAANAQLPQAGETTAPVATNNDTERFFMRAGQDHLLFGGGNQHQFQPPGRAFPEMAPGGPAFGAPAPEGDGDGEGGSKGNSAPATGEDAAHGGFSFTGGPTPDMSFPSPNFPAAFALSVPSDEDSVAFTTPAQPSSPAPAFSFTATVPPATQASAKQVSDSPQASSTSPAFSFTAPLAMEAPAASASPQSASTSATFSFIAAPSASAVALPSFGAPKADAALAWEPQSEPLTFGVGVKEYVGDLDPDEEEEIQALRLQMPTYSFSAVASAQSKQQQLEAAVAANNIEELRKLAPTLSEEETSTRNWGLETPIVVAAKEEKWEIVEILAGVMGKKELNYSDSLGRTAVHWAARHGHLPLLKLLLEKVQPEGKELKAIDQQVSLLQDGKVESPVHSAVLGGKAEALRVLVGHYAVNQLNLENSDQLTPLALCAAEDPEGELAAILVEALPAEMLIVRSFRGSTSLDAAIRENNVKLLELLIDRAPATAVGYVFPDGSSHMHGACAVGNVLAVKKMIEKVPGFVVASNGYKVPPIAIAASRGYAEIVDLLLKDLDGIQQTAITADVPEETFASLLAVEKGFDDIAMRIMKVQGIAAEARVLAKAFGRSDSKLIKFLFAQPEFGKWFYGHPSFQHELPKAPIAHFELLFEMFPTRPLCWFNLNSSSISDYPPSRMKAILAAARRYCTLGYFRACLGAAMEFAVRVSSKELLQVGLDCYDHELCHEMKGFTPEIVVACCTASTPELLMFVLEGLPEKAFVDDLNSFCSVFAAAVPREDFLRVLLDWFPRKLWTLPHRDTGENVVLAACRSASHGDDSCLKLVFEYFTEEELLIPNERGAVLTHLAGMLPVFVLELIAEKLSTEAFLIGDDNGWNSLHLAASTGDEVQVQWLLEHLPAGAKNIRLRAGETPLDVARGKFGDDPSEKMVSLLSVQPKAALRKG